MVDSSVYIYQFLGRSFDFYSDAMPFAIEFKVGASDYVSVRDPKSKHLTRLTLFRKLAGPEYGHTVVHVKKMKRRDWMNVEVSAAIPHVIDATDLLVLASAPKLNIPSLCVYDTTWEYTVEAQGKSYMVLWRNGEPLNITINGANEFALGQKGSAYLIDDDGKERKVRLAAAARKP